MGQVTPVNKKVILIPYFVKEQLNRNSFPLSSLSNIEQVKSVLSKNDLDLLYVLQNTSFPELGPLSAFCDGLEFNGSISKAAHELVTFGSVYATPNGLSSSTLSYYDNKLDDGITKLLEGELRSRLFCKESYRERYTQPYEIVDTDRSYVYVVIYPGYFVDTLDIKLRTRLLEDLIKLFYRYYPQHVVAGMPLFTSYLELLSGFKSSNSMNAVKLIG